MWPFIKENFIISLNVLINGHEKANYLTCLLVGPIKLLLRTNNNIMQTIILKKYELIYRILKEIISKT